MKTPNLRSIFSPTAFDNILKAIDDIDKEPEQKPEPIKQPSGRHSKPLGLRGVFKECAINDQEVKCYGYYEDLHDL